MTKIFFGRFERSAQSPSITNILWDLSGTLVRPSSTGLTIQEAGDDSLIFYLWSGKKEPSRIDTMALSVLNLLGEQTGNPAEIIRLHTGEPIPLIICSYIGGHITAEEGWQYVQSAMREWMAQNAKEKAYFPLIERVLKAFFTPAALAHCMEPIPESLQLLQDIAHAGKAQLYILSNWDSESFDLLYKKLSTEIFSHFPPDHIVISGDAKALKPHPRIYEYFFKKAGISPFTCFFIDDQAENLDAAREFGVDSALFSPNSVDDIRSRLTSLKIL